MSNQRWVEVTPSQFTFEAEGLRLIQEMLPDEPPFRAWSNFEFRDSQGKWHEIDLVVLGRKRMHLIELKYYTGTLRGDDHVWRRDGKSAEDSPLKLARRKAQRLASKLKDELSRLARETGADLPDLRTVAPYVQEAVFLHHPNFKCLLPMASRQDLFGPDGASSTSLLTGISERLLEPAEADPKWAIGGNRSDIIATLMKGIGAVQRRQREAGSWIIDEEPLDEGLGWQDWPAFQKVTQDRARIRFFVNPPGTSQAEAGVKRSLAEHEYKVVSRLAHDGVITPRDIVDTEMGVGLVYPRDEKYQRLDLWLADRPDGVALLTQLTIVRQIAEALGYAHGHRVVHRALNPSAVFVRERQDGSVQVKVGSWQAAGSVGSNTTGAVSSPVTMLGAASSTAMRNAEAAATSELGLSPSAFQAPEGLWSQDADRIRLDVFALGALAYYLVANRSPAASRAALRDRLSRDGGLDLAADLAQVPSALRNMVLGATRPTVSERTSDIGRFLSDLAEAERGATPADPLDESDPLDAAPGTLIGNRFQLNRRLGAGSTAVGLLVTDLTPEDDKADPRRVLKVAVDDEAAGRLTDEASVLAVLKSPRIVRLIDGPLLVGNRTALLLQFAGEQTLADLLRLRNRLSLDLLERYGSDLLAAVVALDAAGVDHRDLKPANLGVVEARGGNRAKHLMLFDFSLTRAAAASIDAGTRGYLDPYLGTGTRNTFDSAAERYSAAVVLYEMASGSLPVYGDGESDPVASGAELQLQESLFDSTVAPHLVRFFGQSLNPDVTRRHHTIREMLADWQGVFAPVPHTQPDNADKLAEEAVASTLLEHAGLSARALSALEPLSVRTVGDLVSLDPVRLNRLHGAADVTRREVKSRANAWRIRLRGTVSGSRNGSGTETLPGPAAAVEVLHAALTGPATSLRNRAARGILGIETGLDAFVAPGELGPALQASRPRGPQLIDEMQQVWADDPGSRTLLDAISALAVEGLDNLGGVAAVRELADLVLSSLPGPADVSQSNTRLCAGLLRVALDRLAALKLAGAAEQPLAPRRRRDGRLSTIAIRSDLNIAADAASRRADELVGGLRDSLSDPLITAQRAATQLRLVFDKRIDPDQRSATQLDDTRLIRLATALSTHAAVAGDGSLHHRDLPAAVALGIALSGLAPSEQIGTQELRDRVRARFPAIALLPSRAQGLDLLIKQAGLPLVYDEASHLYRSPQYGTTTPGLPTRVTMHAPNAIVRTGGHLERRLAESVSARSFLALGVPAGRYEQAMAILRDRLGATVVDVTDILVTAMRRQADELGLPWDTVMASDAAESGSRAAAGLASLVSRTVPAVHEAIESQATTGAGPVLITEAAPLARYGQLAGLTRWSDLTAPRPAAVWLLIPQLHGVTNGLLDGKPVPLGAPGQFITLNEEWLTAMTASTALQPGGLPS